MTGVIWFVQVVHYPLFARVAPESFTTYHAAHVRRTSWVVVGPMLLELLSAFVVLSKAEEGTPQILSAIGLTLLMLIWGARSLAKFRRTTNWRAGIQAKLDETSSRATGRGRCFGRCDCLLFSGSHSRPSQVRAFKKACANVCQTVPSPSGAPRLASAGTPTTAGSAQNREWQPIKSFRPRPGEIPAGRGPFLWPNTHR